MVVRLEGVAMDRQFKGRFPGIPVASSVLLAACGGGAGDGDLPGTFERDNLLGGRFKNGDLQISVDQLKPRRGDGGR